MRAQNLTRGGTDMPLDFGDWLTAHGPEYINMVDTMLKHDVSCNDVIEWILSRAEEDK